MVETVYADDQNSTNLIIGRGDDVQTVSNWEYGGKRFAPVRPDNNLLKHHALLLPSMPADFETLDRLLADIESYVSEYVLLSEHSRQIVTAFVLLSWVYDAFNELPYLRFRGDYGTGKSRALIVAGSLCYKAFFASGASTVAPIFHTLDLFRGTLVLDEADFRFTDEKAELVKILNNGNARGFPVLRMQANAKKEFDPRAFRVFGPKIVAMRSSYADRALESRFITIEMLPGAAGGVPINLPDCQREEALRLRNKLLMYRLRYRNQVNPDSSLADEKLEARTNQILLPLLSIAPTERMRAAILGAAATSYAAVLVDRSESLEGRVLAALRKLNCGKEPVRVADIAASIAASEEEFDQPITARIVGKVLRRLGLTLYKRNGTSAITPGQGPRVSALFARYGLESISG
ncbi:MAG: hypothetical protein JO001_29110 [Alphaproteobacteria bacterium]|nr:hypothetical protein [Alphaproteobacteria bacterium]